MFDTQFISCTLLILVQMLREITGGGIVIFFLTKTNMTLFCSTFSVAPSEVPEDILMEIIELQCDSNPKENLALLVWISFFLSTCLYLMII